MRARHHHRLLAVMALLLFFALALDTAGRKAVTTDEPLHLVHSVAMRQTGVMALPEMHVPLTYRLVGGLLRTERALPEVMQAATWPSANPYEISREYLWRHDLPIDRVIWLGRFVVALMGVVLGALLAGWAWTLTGGHRPATTIVLALYALSPNLLAAAALLTTDMAATVTWLAAVYTWWRYWRRPGRGRWLLAAVALGLALAAKLTGVLLLPVTFVLAYVAAWPVGRGQPGRGEPGRGKPRARLKQWARPALVWLALLPVAGLVLWALYGFETHAALPMPAYWEAWRLLLTEVEASHANFFLGRVTPVGSWFYFPVTLLLKTPLLQLALFLAIPVVLWRSVVRGQSAVGQYSVGQSSVDQYSVGQYSVGQSSVDQYSVGQSSVGQLSAVGGRPSAVVNWQTVSFLALPAAVLLAVAAVSRLNYGYRHALPAMPFLMLLGGLAAAWLWELPGRARPFARLALTLAVGWTVVAGLRTHPDHLTYFNEAARGQGWRLLGDSNLDWGQDLNQLAAYAATVRATTGRPLLFSYTGMADRGHYGLRGPSLVEQFKAGRGFAAANPPAGRYAINASDLQGTGLILGLLDEIDLFDWFRHRPPLTTLGGSIFVYDVAVPAAGEWIAHCATPGRLLDGAAAERLVGRAGLRHVTFDCNTSWVFPAGPGWYVLPPGERWIDDWLGEARPEMVYRHRANAYGPDYVIAHWAGGVEGVDGCLPSPQPSPGGRGGTAPSPGGRGGSEPSPQPSPEGRGGAEPSPEGRGGCSPALIPYTAAASDAPATLRAYGMHGSEWVTVWEVRQATAAPLSVQGHLLDDDGSRRVSDGLGFVAEQWRPGDWFVQRHSFVASGDTLETGLYDYTTSERVGQTFILTTDR